MSHKYRHVLTFLCLTSIFLPYFFTFLQFSTPINNGNSNLLKYEVNDVFVGSLNQTIQIINNETSRIMGGELFVPLIRNETARHYVILNISSSMGQPAILIGNKIKSKPGVENSPELSAGDSNRAVILRT